MQIQVTLWGKEAEAYDASKLSGFPVLAIKACRISDYNSACTPCLARGLRVL